MNLRNCFLSSVVGLLVVGGAQAQDGEPTRGGTAVFAIPSDPSLLMRNASSQTVDGALACIVYEGLMGSDVSSRPIPRLAESVEVSEDGKTYTFKLRHALWHDGEPLTSEDVRFTLEEVSAEHSAIFGRVVPFIAAVETPAPDTVVIQLNEPYSPLLNSLTCLQGTGIVPAHVFAGSDLLSNPAMASPVGTGPFRMTEWVRGSHLTMERFPDYWDEGLPYLDGLIAQIIPTSAGRVQALLSGQIDRIAEMGMDVASYPLIEGNPDTELMVNHEPPGATMVFLNLEREPFDDVRVRRALFMAMDREYIADVAFGNAGNVGLMPFPAGIEWAANPNIDYPTMYPFDVEQANALLDEAGLAPDANGVRFTLDLVYQATFPGGGEISAALDNMWGAVGVDVNVSALESGAATQRVYIDGDFDGYFVNYSSMGDPALGVARTFVSTSIGVPNGNASRYSNPEIDAMFAAAVRTASQEESGAIYREIQTILAEDLPVLTFVSKTTYDAQRIDLMGMDNEYNHATWREAWLDR
jgi:peptide/nickel transport system substrate-binding protein